MGFFRQEWKRIPIYPKGPGLKCHLLDKTEHLFKRKVPKRETSIHDLCSLYIIAWQINQIFTPGSDDTIIALWCARGVSHTAYLWGRGREGRPHGHPSYKDNEAGTIISTSTIYSVF